jgi:Nicotianamine synthase protein
MSQDAGDGDSTAVAQRAVAERAVAVRAVHDELAGCRDLQPGPVVDAAFRRLVRLVVDTPHEQADAVLAHPALHDVVDDLRSLCFLGEYQLEAAWAQRIAESDDPVAELERFPFAGNYRRLHAMEREAVERLAGAGGRSARAAFVGSGPLPLTAFLLAGEGVRVDNLDRDAAALALSREVAGALGVTGLRFVQVDAGGDDVVDLVGYGLVILAALVGRTPGEKAEVIAHVADAMAPGALLLVRSARGLRTLLYPAVDPSALAGLDVLGAVHPTGEVINSVIVARTPPKER